MQAGISMQAGVSMQAGISRQARVSRQAVVSMQARISMQGVTMAYTQGYMQDLTTLRIAASVQRISQSVL